MKEVRKMSFSRNFGSFLVYPELLKELEEGQLASLRLFEESNPEAVTFRSSLEKISLNEIPESRRPGKREKKRKMFDAQSSIKKGIAFVESIPLEDSEYLYPISSAVIPGCALKEITKVKILRERGWPS